MFLTKFFQYLIEANIFILLAAVTFVGIEACLLGLRYRKIYSTEIRLLIKSLVVAALQPIAFHNLLVRPYPTSPHVSEIVI